MEIIEGKALLFRTRQPQKYEIIPKKAVVERYEDGVALLVKWGLDEVRVLRNLGLRKAPSPITGRYNWPGRHKPMAHQVETAAFLTLHRRAFVFNDPGCVDADTEYLSPTGWRRIADYDGGLVAQYHPDTGAAEFVEPQEFVKLPCEHMVRIKTKYGLDQMLSPEHRTLIRSNAADKWCVMEAAEVLKAHDDWHAGVKRPNARRSGSSTVGFGHMAIPTAFYMDGGDGLAFSEAQLRVQVAVIADGRFNSNTNRCVVRLKRARKVERMRALLTAAGIEFSERLQDTPTAQGFHVFTFPAPLRCKSFDARFWSCTAAQRAVVLDEVVYWDGCARAGERGFDFSSTSKESADFVQYAAVAAGHIARIKYDRRDKYRGGVCYTVTVRGGSKGGAHGLLSLKNRGAATVFTAPSTDGFKYCFRVPSTFLIFRRNGCVFASGNTGKTLSALWAADYLMRIGEVRRVLILCPLSIMHSAWMGDLQASVIHRSAIIAHHSKASRRAEMVRGDYEFVISNYEGVDLISDEIVKDGRFDLVIVDECGAYKNPSTDRWKALARILTKDTYLWMMTGSPASQSPEDAFGLARLVCPQRVPLFKTAWRDRVMYKLTKFKWVPKPNAKELVFDALQPAIRFKKSDCLDLPPVVTETRFVELTAQQKRYYNLLKEQALVRTAGETITAINAAAEVSKLLQISAGAAYSDNSEVVEFDATPRMNVLEEVLRETDRKVIVFALFRSSISAIVSFLNKKGIETDEIHGDVKPSKRGEIINRFQTQPQPRILVMQPQATAHGITLTAADTVVFFGPLMSVEHYTQAIARSDRKGQTSDKVTVVHIQSSPIEEKMFKALVNKVDDNRLLTDMFKAEIG